MHWVEAMNKSNKLRERAMLASNEKFQDLWHKLADDLQFKYFMGQPWLRWK